MGCAGLYPQQRAQGLALGPLSVVIDSVVIDWYIKAVVLYALGISVIPSAADMFASGLCPVVPKY